MLGRLEQVLGGPVVAVGKLVGDALAQNVDGAVAHYAEQPCSHAASARVEVVARAPDREECLLDDLLGDRRARAHVRGERHRNANVAAIEQGKSVWVANDDERHQGLVG